MKFISFVLVLVSWGGANACDLCAVYRAADARGESGDGFGFTIAEQYIPYRTSQFNGQEVNPPNPDWVDSSITHFVLGYNVSSRFGVSLNVPLVVNQFKRTDLSYSLTAPPVIFTEQGTETGLGDMSLIGRVTVFQKLEMEYGFVVNVLGGVKFPTGNDERLDEEVEQTEIFTALLPPGTPHDPLSHSISSVHQHNISPGSGSYDGIFGITMIGNWQRLFLNAQLQYYLRSEGRSGFKYGNELMVSGGPGVFVLLDKAYTLSLQAFALYDNMAEDEVLGVPSTATGLTAWYLGPVVNFTWGSRLSANVGAEFPLSIDNNGYQSVPNYRLHGGVSWRF